MDLLASFATEHGGVFTRTVALDAGYTDAAIRHSLRHGHWVRLRNGVYADARQWQRAGRRDRHLMMAHAVALRCDPDITFSHITGAIIRGWPSWNIPLDTGTEY